MINTFYSAGNLLNLVGLSLIVIQCLTNLTGDLLAYSTSPMGVMVAFGIFLFNMSAVAVVRIYYQS